MRDSWHGRTKGNVDDGLLAEQAVFRSPARWEAGRGVPLRHGLEDDVGTIAPRVNAYLLRFYFQIRGMPESEFMARLHALQQRKEAAHG